MQLPNKLYSFNESSLVLFAPILKYLSSGPKPPKELYKQIKPFLNDPSDFLSAMDCLYALNAIELTDEMKVSKCL